MLAVRGRPALYCYRTRAWSTEVSLSVSEPRLLPVAAGILRRELDRMDRLASRFRTDSELSRLNGSAGARVAVSDDLFELLALSLRVASATGGAVDPTVGGALCHLGYDRDFATIASASSSSRHGQPQVTPRPVAGWTSLELDATTRTVRAPRGTLLDFGATAKALASDRVAAEVVSALGCAAVVSLGGDVAVAGEPPEGGFAVGIADTCAPGPGQAPSRVQTTVVISSGAVATSGILARRWSRGGTWVHHIVDPSTGAPADPVWRTVSVAGATCVDANAASTAAIVQGVDGPEWLESLGMAARLVHLNGDVVHTGGWPEAKAR